LEVRYGRWIADPPLADLIALCERVLAVDMSEEQLAQAWPDEPAHRHLRELREALFSGLEHLPGTVVNGEWRLDPDQWRGTPEYDDISSFLGRLRAQA